MIRNLILLACALATAAHAQSTYATITGAVTDPNGALVPNASIEAVNKGTNYRYTANSNEAGQYTVANLLPGTYTLRATAAGFERFEAADIELSGRDQRRVDIHFALGQVSTKVEVSAGATVIETETARVSDVKDRATLNQLPLSLRRSWDFITLSPGVSKPQGSFYYRFNGSRNKQGDASFDGISIASTFGGPVTGVLTDRTEGYSEIRLDSAGNSAEYAGIGQLSVVTRSGNNKFHGSVFEYYTSPGLQARNPFSVSGTASVEHVPGGSIGGPVIIPKIYNGRNRTFFFTTLEFERFGSPSVVLFNPTVPLAAWRKGDFSNLLPGTVVKDPFANNAPFAGNVIPTSRLNPFTRAVQDRFLPLPNFGDPNTLIAQNYRETKFVPKPVNPTLTFRADHRFSDKDSAYVRFTRVDWDISNWVSALPTVGESHANRYSRAVTVAYSRTIRPNLLSEARWGYASDNLPLSGPIKGADLASQLGIQGLFPNTPANLTGVYNFSFTGIGLSGLPTGSAAGEFCNPCSYSHKHVAQEHITWIKDRHSMKFGFYVSRGGYTDYRVTAGLFGNDSFSNRFTGFAYGDFLLGIPTTAARESAPITQDLRNWTYAWFAQDEFRIHPKLTVSYGLRYELHPGFRAANGAQAIFDIGTGKIVVPDEGIGHVSSLLPKGYVDVVSASGVGLPSQALIRTPMKDFAPRVGIAYRPFGNNTVFRAGYGIFYDLVPRNPSAAGIPFRIAEPAYTNSATSPAVILPLVFPQSGAAGPSTVSIPSAINPDIQIPLSMQYNVSVDHQIGNTALRIAYVGTNTRHGIYSYDYNQPAPDTRAYIAKPRAFPNYPNISYFTNGAGHQYNGFTMEAKHRLENGLHFQAYFAWARDIGDLEDGQSPENALDRKRERAVWPDIPTHRFSTNAIYELPFGKGKRFNASNRVLGTLASNWEIGVIGAIEDGFFLTPQWTGPDPTGTRYTTSSTAPVVTLRPNELKDPGISNPTIAHWFDPSAFSAPTAGLFGTSAKGVIKGPGTKVLHAALSRNFIIRERTRVRLEFNATNVLNHPNYRDPDTNILNSGTVGSINAISDRNYKVDSAIPRYLQLLVRVDW